MQIHVVEPGQTLSSIGRQYQIAPGLIARYNGLAPPYSLAVGQSLLILTPSSTYTVREGDTLSSVSRRTGVGVLELLRANPNLGGTDALYPGQILVLGFTDQPLRAVEANGYAYSFVRPEILRGILPFTTYLTPFTYGITADGGLVPLDDGPLLELARQYGVQPWMHLSTLTESGVFSSALAQSILDSPQLQEVLADNVVRTMEEKGYQGLDVDFEYISGSYAQAYAQFVGLLRRRVNAAGLEVIVALAPKTSADQPGTLYEGHNYRLLGENADAVLLMTYEWGYTYGPPMAVAPIDSVRRVLDYAVTEIPPEKIFMGFPNYAYDWSLPYNAGASRATLISNEYAAQLAVEKGAEIRFDERAQTPYFSYLAESGVTHEVWFEDARSSYQKLLLIRDYGFRGVGFWNYMRPFTAGFSILNTLYTIENKVASAP